MSGKAPCGADIKQDLLEVNLQTEKCKAHTFSWNLPMPQWRLDIGLHTSHCTRQKKPSAQISKYSCFHYAEQGKSM